MKLGIVMMLSLVMAFFVLSFFPRDVLDENWDLIESVSDGLCSTGLMSSTRLA